MSRQVEPNNQTYGPSFERLCGFASDFWRNNDLPAGDGVILVDLLYQDIRVAIRVLTFVGALRRYRGMRVIGLLGPDPYWLNGIWSYYDSSRLEQVARAYGVTEFLDLAGLVQSSLAGQETVVMDGRSVWIPSASLGDPKQLGELAEATVLRAFRIPRLTDEIRAGEECIELLRRCDHYARVCDAILGSGVAAFVTSHIDYHQWGYAVEAAVRHGVDVHHVQSTGCLKSYAHFPAMTRPGETLRMTWTQEIAEFFEERVWPHRDLLWRSAELSAYRSKSNQGRPSWWRAGGSASQLGYHTCAERDSVRQWAMEKLGLDPARPVVAVFNHAVSDAVHTNHEAFDGLADWFEQTVDFASSRAEVSWLMIDHPAQLHYESTGWFESIASTYSEQPHLRFFNSMEFSKNLLWSLVDTAVTVRGSVSNEFPAYGVPALQAGWSEWSHCGFTSRADTQEQYWAELKRHIRALLDGSELITPDQVRRARLWLWLYRAGADVATPLVPQWESGQGSTMQEAVCVAMGHIEADADPSLVAVRRLLDVQAPMLTRVDFETQTPLLGSVAPVGELDRMQCLLDQATINPGFATWFDREIDPSPLPLDITSGEDRAIMITDGMVNGRVIVGRFTSNNASLGLKVVQLEIGIQIALTLSLDDHASRWYADRHSGMQSSAEPKWRIGVLRQGGAQVGSFLLHPVFAPEARIQFEIKQPVCAGGILFLELAGVETGETGWSLDDALCGVMVSKIEVGGQAESAPHRQRLIQVDADELVVMCVPGQRLALAIPDEKPDGARNMKHRSRRFSVWRSHREVQAGVLPADGLRDIASTAQVSAWSSLRGFADAQVRLSGDGTLELLAPGAGGGEAYCRVRIDPQVRREAGLADNLEWELRE